MVSDKELNTKITVLNKWIEETRRYPHVYDNVKMVSLLSANLINEMVSDREKMNAELDRLKARLALSESKE